MAGSFPPPDRDGRGPLPAAGRKASAGRAEYTLFAGLLALSAASAAMLVAQVADPTPLHFAGFTVDRLSAALTLLVASVGSVTFRFAIRYLDGERGVRRFLRTLGFTVIAAYVFMLASNLLVLYAGWVASTLGLHRLLTHYPERYEARRPARKKFLINRLGDAALLAAIAVIWFGWGTFDLNVLLRNAHLFEGTSATVIGLLVALAALTRSALFPFHTWLPETMESPTPVSALMHAGMINAGGALLVQFAPLIVRLPLVLFLLSLAGTLTVALGVPAMWAQTNVKRTLAWSTVGQMGFMMVQFGLAAFPAAALHIVCHGCYKAWSFLRAAGLPAYRPSPAVPPASLASTARSLALAAFGTLAGVPVLAAASWATGYSPAHSPGELALTAIVGLAIGQLWATLLKSPARGPGEAAGRVAKAAAASVATAFVSFSLYRATDLFLAPVMAAPVMGMAPPPTGPLSWAAAALPVVTLLGLVVLHAFLPWLGTRPAGRAFFVHAVQGFYVGAVEDRFVERVWPSAPERSVDRA